MLYSPRFLLMMARWLDGAQLIPHLQAPLRLRGFLCVVLCVQAEKELGRRAHKSPP